MHELTIHVVGTGAVGLACGYLLSARGHRVVHTSLRGVGTDAVPVSVQGAGPVVRALYRPRYRVADDVAAQVTIFAVHDAQLAAAVHAYRGAAPAVALAFCSMPAPLADAAAREDQCPLVYPLLSAELGSDSELRIATTGAVEVCAAPQARVGLAALMVHMGWHVSAWVPRQRFYTLYLQTATLYVALLAVGAGLIARAQVDVQLLGAIHGELLAMAGQPAGAGPRDAWHAVAALLASDPDAGKTAAGESTLLAANLTFLLGAGQRKLVLHLAALAPAWSAWLASSPAQSPCARLIAAVLAIATDRPPCYLPFNRGGSV